MLFFFKKHQHWLLLIILIIDNVAICTCPLLKNLPTFSFHCICLLGLFIFLLHFSVRTIKYCTTLMIMYNIEFRMHCIFTALITTETFLTEKWLCIPMGTREHIQCYWNVHVYYASNCYGVSCLYQLFLFYHNFF